MQIPTVTDYKNPIYMSVDQDLIDLDILTEEFGWIPTTIRMSDDDTQGHIVQIKNWLHAYRDTISEYVPPVVEEVVFTEITKLQCKKQAVTENLWDTLKSALSADDEIREDWDLATSLVITEPSVQAMGVVMGKTPEELQTFFNAAGLL